MPAQKIIRLSYLGFMVFLITLGSSVLFFTLPVRLRGSFLALRVMTQGSLQNEVGLRFSGEVPNVAAAASA